MYLTGGLRVDGPHGSFADGELPGVQGRVAFAALVVERHPVARDALADIIWDGRVPDKWDGALSTIVSKLRTLLTRIGFDGKSVVTTSGSSYAVVLPAGTWVDLEDARSRLDRAEGALRHGDPATACEEATVASGILRRPFLAGVENEWVEAQRRVIRHDQYRSTVALAQAWTERGDHGLAVTLAEWAIELDPLREIGHRLLMTAEWRRGDRGAALRALDRCEQVLWDELGVTPSPATVALAARIRE